MSGGKALAVLAVLMGALLIAVLVATARIEAGLALWRNAERYHEMMTFLDKYRVQGADANDANP